MTKRQLARAGEKTKSQLASEIYQMLITLKKPIDSSSELIFLSRVLSHNRKAELQYWHDDLSAEIAETPVITIEDIKEETKMQNPNIESLETLETLKVAVTETFNTRRKALKNLVSTESAYMQSRKHPDLLKTHQEATKTFIAADKAFTDALYALEDAGGDFRLSEVEDTSESPRRAKSFTKADEPVQPSWFQKIQEQLESQESKEKAVAI